MQKKKCMPDEGSVLRFASSCLHFYTSFCMENAWTRFGAILERSWTRAAESMVEIFPQALLALVIVLVGFIIALVARFLLLKLLSLFPIDKLAAKTQLESMLKSVGIRKSVSHIFGSLLFWLIVLFTLVFASEVLRLTQVANALSIVTGYLPKIIAAFLIVVVGMLLAKFLQTVVIQALGSTHIGYERTMGKAVNVIVVIFAVIAALEQLEIDLSLITTNFVILLGVGLFVAGAGLVAGSRPVLENFFAGQNVKSSLLPGDTVKILDHHGKVKSVSGTTVVLDAGGHDVLLPARLFQEHSYTRTRS